MVYKGTMETEKINEDIFGLFTKQIKEVQEKPFKKLAFLGISLGISLGMTLGIANLGVSMYEHAKAQEQKQQVQATTVVQSEKNALVTKIKSIPHADFNNFLDYLKNQQNFYDTRVEKLSNALREAEITNFRRTAESKKATKNLNEDLKNYKNDYDKLIHEVTGVYNNAQTTPVLTDIAQMKNFLGHYSSYQSGLPKRNEKMEEALHNYLFVKDSGNQEYNHKNNIYAEQKNLEKEAIATIKTRQFK